MAEMGANEKRSYVEDCWEWSVFWKPAPLPNPHEDEMLPWTMQVADAKYLDVHEFTGATEEECVSSAYEFTIQRQEEIRRRTIGLGLLKECMPGDGWHSAEQVVIAGEIYTREQAALADLQRGMKEVPHGTTE